MRHVDIDLVLMVVEGRLPPRALARAMFEHLKAACPECKRALTVVGEEAEARLFERREEMRPEGHPISGFDPSGQEALRFAEEVRNEWRRAQSDLARLLAAPPDGRAARIKRARTRYRSRSFAELLIDESRKRARLDPCEAAALAELVPEVLYRIPRAADQTWSAVLRIRALASCGNALRVGGELSEAERRFEEARRRMIAQVPHDAELYAEIASLEASLRSDQRRFAEAERLLDRAVLIHGERGDELGLSRGLIQRGDVRRNRGDLEGAVEDLVMVLPMLTAADRVELRLCAVSNLALCYCDLGRFEAAHETVNESRSAFRRHEDRWANARLCWLEGRIAHGLNQPAEAERLLLEARNSYIGSGLHYDAAMVSLDLALVYLDQRRNTDVRRIARLIEPTFRAKNIHREAVAALLLFHQAAHDDSLTVALIGRVQRFLEESRKNPKLRFRATEGVDPESG